MPYVTKRIRVAGYYKRDSYGRRTYVKPHIKEVRVFIPVSKSRKKNIN